MTGDSLGQNVLEVYRFINYEAPQSKANRVLELSKAWESPFNPQIFPHLSTAMGANPNALPFITKMFCPIENMVHALILVNKSL